MLLLFLKVVSPSWLRGPWFILCWSKCEIQCLFKKNLPNKLLIGRHLGGWIWQRSGKVKEHGSNKNSFKIKDIFGFKSLLAISVMRRHLPVTLHHLLFSSTSLFHFSNSLSSFWAPLTSSLFELYHLQPCSIWASGLTLSLSFYVLFLNKGMSLSRKNFSINILLG